MVRSSKSGSSAFSTAKSHLKSAGHFASGCIKKLAHRVSDVFTRTFRGTWSLAKHSVSQCGKNPFKAIFLFIKGICRALFSHRQFVFSAFNIIAPVSAAALLIFTVHFWTGAVFALEITNNGNHLAYVASESVYNEAKTKLASRLLSAENNSLSIKPAFSLAMVSKAQVKDANTLANTILESSDLDLTEAAGLYVDNRFLAACASQTEIDLALNAFLQSERELYSDCDAEFNSKVEIVDGLYRESSLIDRTNLENILKNSEEKPLSVKITRKQVSVKDIAFPTVEVKDETKDTSYKKITTKGKLGKEQVTEAVVYIDGVESGRVVEKVEVIEEPVEKKIVVGTSERVVAAALAPEGDGVSIGTFVWPVQSVPRMYVSAYWGDNRGHKGVDIAAPNGTIIYAADGGTVVSVKSSSGYGKYFIVDHGNNISTLYSHCSAIDVQVGQKVTRGQPIAKIGRTGNATGNHLHFEVQVGGVQVNPAPYLGLKK